MGTTDSRLNERNLESELYEQDVNEELKHGNDVEILSVEIRGGEMYVPCVLLLVYGPTEVEDDTLRELDSWFPAVLSPIIYSYTIECHELIGLQCLGCTVFNVRLRVGGRSRVELFVREPEFLACFHCILHPNLTPLKKLEIAEYGTETG